MPRAGFTVSRFSGKDGRRPLLANPGFRNELRIWISYPESTNRRLSMSTAKQSMHQKTRVTLDYLDAISEKLPFTQQRACRLLYRLVSGLKEPKVLEVACCYGKATLYLAAAV